MLVLLASAAMIAVEERSFEGQARRHLEERGRAALDGAARELAQLRRAHETFARLLADTPGLAEALERADRTVLERMLQPIQANQAFEEITIYRADGSEILQLGRPKGDRIDASLFASGMSGRTDSKAMIDPSGLVVLASTPITTQGETLAVLVVASTFTGSELIELKHQEAGELAFFQYGNLVTTSTDRAELIGLLQAATLTKVGVERLNQKLSDVHLFAAVGQLEGGKLLALASSADLAVLARQRKTVVLGATALLLAAFSLIAFFVARTVTRPLKAMAAVTGRMLSGDYKGRVAHSRIPELDTLATAVNYLAERVEDQARLEEELRQSQKMEAVGRLAGGIAHDFNNLLTAITCSSELLHHRLGDPESLQKLVEESKTTLEMCEERLQRPEPVATGGLRDPSFDDLSQALRATTRSLSLLLERFGRDPIHYVEEIGHAADRAAALTRQLLVFSRRQMLQPKVLDLKSVVGEMEKMLRRLIGENIDLAVLVEADLGPVRADQGQIEQVVMNLVLNARDAMPDGGRVTLEAANVELDESHVDADAGSWVMLAVRDTGTGIDAETLSRAFEPFFTTKAEGKGTGLGLSTVYGIVKQSGGHVRAESELGRGTTFRVYLPHVVAEVQESEPSTNGRPAGGSETILLVEDEDVVRDLARVVLTEAGYSVLDASRAIDALRLCGEHNGPIDLMLTDVVMPEMSGGTLAERLGSLRRETKVLFMSGYTDEAVVQHGVLDGRSAFLQKPFTPDALRQKVRQVLDAA